MPSDLTTWLTELRRTCADPDVLRKPPSPAIVVALVDVVLTLQKSGYRDPRIDAALARLQQLASEGAE